MGKTFLAHCFIFFLLLASAVCVAGGWQEFVVYPFGEDQEKPDIHGDRIVWQQLEGEPDNLHYNIVGAELTDAEPTFLDVAYYPSTDQVNPAIWGDFVVWQDSWSGDWAIYTADIGNINKVKEYLIAEALGINFANPAISGNTILWQEDSAGADDIDIWGTDMVDPNSIWHYGITLSEFNQESPAIHRNTVVWQSDEFGPWDVLYGDIWQINNPVTHDDLWNDFDQEGPSVWGDIVVWSEDVEGDTEIWAAKISRTDNPEAFAICQAPSHQQNPDVGDNLVVWEDFRNDNWDIYGYNLTTGEEFQITDHPEDQRYPAVSGNTVVWQDLRDGGPWTIYAAELFGPEVARCDVKPGGDVNGDCKVDIADLAEIAANWLNCGLDEAQACL